MIYAKSLAWSHRDAAVQRHIAIVTETYPPEINGVASTLAHLVRGLRLSGYKVSVARPRQKRFDESISSDPAVTLVPALPLPSYRELNIGLPAGGILQQCWMQHRPDVVYIATQGPLGWSALRAARHLEIPVFSGFHTNFHIYSEHYHAGWLSFFILSYLRGFHNRTVGTLVATDELRDRLLATGFKNVSVFGRGVDSRLFSPEHRSAALRRVWRAGDDDLVVLYVGRVAPEKNLELAIESYRAMQRVNKAVKFVVVGDGPLRPALQGKHDDFIFCGKQEGQELAKHYASADVFLFPSETETFGNVTLEAMASGLAVVAYDYAAARIHITDGETGLLAPYRRSSEFAGAAVRLAREPQSLFKIRQQARQCAVTLDWQRVIDRFARIVMGTLHLDHTADPEIASDAIGAMDRAIELR